MPYSDDPVHYRLYRSSRFDDEVVVICVQNFDYPDYDESRFVSEERYHDERSAQLVADVLNGAEDYSWSPEYNEVHYRLYRSARDNDRVVVICVQDFDYPDYDEDRFVTDTKYQYEFEADAVADVLRDAHLI